MVHPRLTLSSEEQNAEDECESCVASALKIDPNNIDALQTLATLRIVRANYGETEKALSKVVELTLSLVSKVKD
jgi:cytochrome c-type biogenesis protein CcmH/NrfG